MARAEDVDAVAGGGFFAGPPAGSAGGRPLGLESVVAGEELGEGRPAGELLEIVGAVDVEVAGDDDDLGWMGEHGGEELGASVAEDGDLVGRLPVGDGAEEEEVGEDAGGGLEAHAVEDVAAAGDGVDALDAAGERWAAEGVEVLLESGDEFGVPPLVAVDEDGGLRREEKAAEGEGEGRESLCGARTPPRR